MTGVQKVGSGEAPTPPPAEPKVAVAGERIDRSLADFERSCLVHLEEEQQRPNPDTALIAVLCDAVRLTREHVALAAALPAPIDEQPNEEFVPHPFRMRECKEDHWCADCEYHRDHAIHHAAPVEGSSAETLARQAVNGWACYAKRKIELDEIARLHRELDRLAARPSEPPQGPAWQPLTTCPRSYLKPGDGCQRVLFRGISKGRSFAGYAYVDGWVNSAGEPIHNYSYKLIVLDWMPLPAASTPREQP